MSLLILGLDMPKDGRKHTALIQFLEDGTCRGVVEYSQSYDTRSVKVFEVIPLPEKHGRLGDLDRLEWVLRTFALYHSGEKQQGIIGCCETIKATTTIVPAEGGNADG